MFALRLLAGARISLCAECHYFARQIRRLSRQNRGRLAAYSTNAVSHERPLRMAVIGAGPAGFYTAYRLMHKIPGAKVDMLEALPVPFGLVRYGVAPDHPEVKNAQTKFEEIANSSDFTFVGNVAVGSTKDNDQGNEYAVHVELADVLSHFDAVVFAYGASQDKSLSIPGEATLKGIYSARQFVAWYNGLPDHANLAPDLGRGEEAVIIGQGNVALDVARMLLEDVDVLRKTDITEVALAELSRSRIKRVRIVGRRGPMQAAFTIKEIRELMKLNAVWFNPIDRALIPTDLKKLDRAPRRLMEVLLKGSTSSQEKSALKHWHLDFCLSPNEFRSTSGTTSSSHQREPTWVSSTSFRKTRLSDVFDPLAVANLTDSEVTLPSSTVFRSIGYKSTTLAGFRGLGIPHDEQSGVISNDGMGRVIRDVRTTGGAMAREPFPGLYCSGWVKTGPTGVIVSTMADAFATADAIADDWKARRPFLDSSDAKSIPEGWAGLSRQLGNPRVVLWNDWLSIDKAEKERGQMYGKEREKFTSVQDMLKSID